jgi:hypothetical protein
VIGLLTGASVSGLVAFCMACEPAAIRLIWMIRTRSGHPPGSLRGGTAEFRQLGSNPVRHVNNWFRPILRLV